MVLEKSEKYLKNKSNCIFQIKGLYLENATQKSDFKRFTLHKADVVEICKLKLIENALGSLSTYGQIVKYGELTLDMRNSFPIKD